MKTNDAVKKVAEELGLPYEVAHKAYQLSWEFIKMKMRELPFEQDLTEEEFKKLRPNFNIPEIGKFVVTWEKYQKIKRKIEYLKKLKPIIQDDTEDKGDKTSVQPTGCE